MKIQSVIILQYEVINTRERERERERAREREILINLCLINNKNTMPVFIQENHLDRIITISKNMKLICERWD